VLTVFGTRPEVIKLAPVIHQLERRNDFFRTVNVTSGQHSELLHPFVEMFHIRVDKNLQLLRANQTPSELCERVLPRLEAIIENEAPDLILVQGDTATALAGAKVGQKCGIPVGHVEAGLRSGNLKSPYPEEMNRRLITQLATYHFAATRRNREMLVSEGIPEASIFLTGNPVVPARIASRHGHRLRPSCLVVRHAGNSSPVPPQFVWTKLRHAFQAVNNWSPICQVAFVDGRRQARFQADGQSPRRSEARAPAISAAVSSVSSSSSTGARARERESGSAMTSSTDSGWPVSLSALQAASKASLITAIASGSNSPGFTKDWIDIAAISPSQQSPPLAGT